MKKNNQWQIKDIKTNKVSSFSVGVSVSKKLYSHFTNFIKNGLTVLISVFIIYGVVQAGTITPPSGTPIAKFYTLSEIYEFIANNTVATEGGHDFTFSDSLAGTGHTLTEIYSALAGLISANTVKLGTSYLGVDGILVPSGGDAGTSNVCNGNTFYGSSQADWNLQTGTLNPTASAIISGNTYCGVAGTAVATPTYGDNDASKVLTIAGNSGTYNATNLSVENVRNAIAFGVGQTGTFSVGYTYGSDTASGVLTTATGTPGTYNVSNLSNSVVKQNTTWGVSLGSTGTLTPDGGTAVVADLFNGKTAHLTADWNLDTGTLDLACNTSVFDGAGNIVTDAYDGAGLGNNRWCMTDSGDAATSDILSGKVAWVDGVERTGTMANNGAQAITPTTTNTAITQGYHDGAGYCAGDTDLTVNNIKKSIDLFGVAGAYSGYPGTGWVANGSGNGSTALNQANCGTAAGWEWFEDGNGDGDTTDPEDGICVLDVETTSKSWNGDDDSASGWRDNTYIASYECEGNFPNGTITAGTYRAIDDIDPTIIYDTTWDDGDCALCQADCYDGKKDLPDNPYVTGSHYHPLEGSASPAHEGLITPEVLKSWAGTRLPTSSDFFGFCGYKDGDTQCYETNCSSDTTLGNYGQMIGRTDECLDLSNSSWEWLSEQHYYNSARIAGGLACSHFSNGYVYYGYRFRAVFRP